MRLVMGLFFAVLVNFALFTIMQSMTSAKSVDRKLIEDIQLLDFVRLKKDTTTDTKNRQLPDKPPPPKAPPPPPEMVHQTVKPRVTTPQLNVPRIDVPLNIAGGPYIGKFSAAPVMEVPKTAQYADVMPLVRIPPRYPRSAARRNVEGVVKIAFTITKDGRVKDPQVLTAIPEGVFEKAAIKAIMKWKFNPKIVNGIAVEQTAAQEIEFKLPK